MKALQFKSYFGMPIKIWGALLFEYFVFVAIIFGGAGTWRWTEGWIFLALLTSSQTAMSLLLAKYDPGLLEERARVLPQQNQPLWDRIILVVLGLLILCWMSVAGLDTERMGWSHMASWLRGAGAVIMLSSFWAAYFVMRQNSYAAPTVRLQEERGQIVISTGAYAYIRHPFYAALIPFFFGGALLLGSWLAFLLAGMISAVLAFRCVKEEEHLEMTLEGYAGYMKDVRYRLILNIW